MTALPARAVAAAAILALALTGCTAKGDDEPVVVEPQGIDFTSIPTDGATGNGIALLEGGAAVREIRNAVRAATWFSATIEFEQRVTPTDEVPDPVESDYRAAVTGTVAAFDATLESGKRSIELHGRDGSIAGTGDADLLTELGFVASPSGISCLTPAQDATAAVTSLLLPGDLIRALIANPDNPVAGAFTSAQVAADDGTPLIEFAISNGTGLIGTMRARANGAPYPLSLDVSDPTGVLAADFTAWDSPGTLSEQPPSAGCA